MADDEAPRRRRGRPPKPPSELSRRPTVGLRVRPETYAAIAEAAQKNGRSMSEEMEARVEAAMSQTTAEIVRAAAEAAASAASKAATEASDKKFSDFVEEIFGGTQGMFLASQFHALYWEAVANVAKSRGIAGTWSWKEDDVHAVTALVCDGVGRIVEQTFAMVFAAEALDLLSKTKVEDGRSAFRAVVERILERNPDQRQRLEAKLSQYKKSGPED